MYDRTGHRRINHNHKRAGPAAKKCPGGFAGQPGQKTERTMDQNLHIEAQPRNSGPPCPRCSRPMQVRQHNHIGAKQQQAPFYYERWFFCTHAGCQTRQVMPAQYIHWNDNPAAQRLRRLQAIREQLRRRDQWGRS
jgi:hypothetical protein